MGRDWTLDEIKAHGRDKIEAAMRRRGHLPGIVTTHRTARGTWYTYTACANRGTALACGTKAEYSIERGKVTASTVAYPCQYETLDQKLTRRSETERHYHVDLNDETQSWAWVHETKGDADSQARRMRRSNVGRPRDRYTVRVHQGACQAYRERLTHQASVPPVTY